MPTRPTQILVNNEATITVAFMDYTGTNDPGNLVDPDSVSVSVLKDNVEIKSDTPFKLGVGEYSYVHLFTEVGDFTVKFTGNFTDQQATPSAYTVVIEEDVQVVASFVGQQKLGTTKEIVFSTDVTPLYADPEEIQRAYPEAGLVEIVELIQKFSLEADRILDTPTPMPQIGYDFIKESTLCALSAIYDPFDMSGGSITLGDLSVDSGRRYNGVVNRGNASNSCERAFVLRQEMLRNARASKAVVKGYRVAKDLPDRKIKHQIRGEL